MRRAAKLLICLATLIAAAPIAADASASDSSLVVLASFEQRSYSPGEVVNFTATIFLNGQSLTPDEAPRASVVNVYVQPIYTFPLVEIGQGRYSGRYTVLTADMNSFGTVLIKVEASYGSSFDAGFDKARTFLYIQVDTGPVQQGPGPIIRAWLANSSDTIIKPQTRLTFQCCVTEDGKPADPQGLRFTMRHLFQTNWNISQVEKERTGPGSYIVRFQVPAQNKSDIFYLDAECTDPPSSMYTGARVKLDFYQVIYHELKRMGSRVDYELLVSDRSGAVVNGSSVQLEISAGHSYFGTDHYYTGQDTGSLDLGRTDRNGRLRSLMDLAGAGGFAQITGWANTSKFSQRFNGLVALPGTPMPQPGAPESDFQVVQTGMEGELSPGGTARFLYQASSDGQLLRDFPVDCYVEVSSVEDSISSGLYVFGQRTVTDDEGRFRLNISYPVASESTARLTFLGPPGNSGARQRYYEVIQVGPDAPARSNVSWANATFSRAEPGGQLGATVTGAGLAAAAMSWDFDHGASGSELPDWSVWSSLELPLIPRENGSLPLKGKMALPRHLHPGQNITVSVRLSNSSGETSDLGFPVRVRSPVQPAGENDLCCLAGAGVVNIALLAFVTISYMKARKTPPKKEFADLDVDERIGKFMTPPGGGPPGPPVAFPFKAELVQNVDCAVCGRKIAKGNTAFGCTCGKKFHEHCLSKQKKCPLCGRDWGAR